MVGCPPLAGAPACLHLVEYEEESVLVRLLPDEFKEGWAEVVIASLALHRLHDHGGNPVVVPLYGLLNLRLCQFLVVVCDGAVPLECCGGIVNSRPVEFCKELVLVRIRCVGETHGIAGPAVERIFQVHYHVTRNRILLCVVFSCFPVESGFKCVFNRKPAAVNEEEMPEAVGKHTGELLNEFGVVLGIEVGERPPDVRGVEQFLHIIGFLRCGMVVSYCEAAELVVSHVQHLFPRSLIHKGGTVALLKVRDNLKTVNQNPAFYCRNNLVSVHGHMERKGIYNDFSARA